MGHSHNLNQACNQFSTGKRIFHSDVIHGYPSANTDSSENKRCASCHINTGLYRIYYSVQFNVTGDYIIDRICNPYQWLAQLLFRIAYRLEKRTMGCPLDTFFTLSLFISAPRYICFIHRLSFLDILHQPSSLHELPHKIIDRSGKKPFTSILIFYFAG